LLLLAVLVPIALCSCAGPTRQFFPGRFYPEDRIYENKTLGFALTYPVGWTLATDPAAMGRTGRKASREFHQQQRELIFLGSTVEGTQGTRGIVDNLNESNEEYLAGIRKANVKDIQSDLGTKDFEGNGIDMKKWDYLYNGFHFVEFMFRSGTYNIRVAFWTRPDLFEKFSAVYEETMNSIDLID
jgi:hypothetical protein